MSGPDARGWGLIGLFALTSGILTALAFNPALSNNTLFVGLSTLIVGSGGLLNALGFYYGSSASGSKKDDTIQTLVGQTPQAPSVTTTAPAPLEQPKL
jgi:hypothetical protein